MPEAKDGPSPAAEADESAADNRRNGQARYRGILKSSALIGASSGAVVVIGMVRTKLTAVLLGPAGVGLFGVYGSILDLVLSIAAMGVGQSGVRQIAEAEASGDTAHVARTVAVLRSCSWALGVIGAIALMLGAGPISQVTFNNEDHVWPIRILGVALLLRLIGLSQGALLQGLRRIRDLATSNVIGAAIGAIATVALIWLYGDRGIAPSIVAGAAIGLIVSWLFVRRIPLAPVTLSSRQRRDEAAGLLNLGLVFMLSSMLMMATGYGIRALVIQHQGVDAAGHYHAAWALAGVYVGFILQAMGADFYPRLVGVIDHPDECNRTVNEQAEISVLLASPGIIATIVFAPVIIHTFYSAAFAPAAEVLRWFCLGVAMRTITWPLGYIAVAKGVRTVIVSIDIAWAAFYSALAWMLIEALGLKGAGIAFFASYLFHLALVYPAARYLTGFRWSRQNQRTCAVLFVCIGSAFSASTFLHGTSSIIAGAIILLLAICFSISSLLRVTDVGRLPARVRSVIARFSSGLERLRNSKPASQPPDPDNK